MSVSLKEKRQKMATVLKKGNSSENKTILKVVMKRKFQGETVVSKEKIPMMKLCSLYGGCYEIILYKMFH